MALNHVGQGADDKGKHHNQTHTDQQGRQVHLLEDLGAALSSAAAGIVRVHRFLPLLLVKHGAEIEVKESGKNIGGFQLGKLGQLDGLAGLFLPLELAEVRLAAVSAGAAGIESAEIECERHGISSSFV